MSKIKVFVGEPGKPFEVREIEDELAAYKEIVGGWIEDVQIPYKNYLAIINEVGKIEGLKPNRLLPHDVLVGNIVIVVQNEDEYSSVDESKLQEVEAALPIAPEDTKISLNEACHVVDWDKIKKV